MNRQQFIEVCDIVLPGNHFSSLPSQQAYDYLGAQSKALGQKWVDSGYTDFSVYDGDQYTLECLWTYLVTSKSAILKAIDVVQKMYPAIAINALDYYNGIGLTTIDMLHAGWKVAAFNDVQHQVVKANQLYQHFDISCVTHTVLPTETFNTLVCLEVLEHLQDPVSEIERLIGLLDDQALIIETTSFSSPWHAGHFPEYNINGVPVAGRIAARKTHDAMKRHGFTRVYAGFNGRPRIWARQL
jgi:hypothetical protein